MHIFFTNALVHKVPAFWPGGQMLLGEVVERMALGGNVLRTEFTMGTTEEGGQKGNYPSVDLGSGNSM